MLDQLIPVTVGHTKNDLVNIASSVDSARFKTQLSNLIVVSALENEAMCMMGETFDVRRTDDWQEGAGIVSTMKRRVRDTLSTRIQDSMDRGQSIVTLEVSDVKKAMSSPQSIANLALLYLPVYNLMSAWMGIGLTGVSMGNSFRILVGASDNVVANADNVEITGPYPVEQYFVSKVKEFIKGTDAPVPSR